MQCRGGDAAATAWRRPSAAATRRGRGGDAAAPVVEARIHRAARGLTTQTWHAAHSAKVRSLRFGAPGYSYSDWSMTSARISLGMSFRISRVQFFVNVAGQRTAAFRAPPCCSSAWTAARAWTVFPRPMPSARIAPPRRPDSASSSSLESGASVPESCVPANGTSTSQPRHHGNVHVAAATRSHGMSTSRPRRRDDPSPRNVHVAAATRPHGISTSRPRRRRDPSPRECPRRRRDPSPRECPRRGRGAAATPSPRHIRTAKVRSARRNRNATPGLWCGLRTSETTGSTVTRPAVTCADRTRRDDARFRSRWHAGDVVLKAGAKPGPAGIRFRSAGAPRPAARPRPRPSPPVW